MFYVWKWCGEYKIRDSLLGKSFSLGNRVTSTTENFKQENRFASITYSELFNDESNSNGLNVFNLGLLNFKPLNEEFGPIRVLSDKKTDVLILQEDKISYVLVEKTYLVILRVGVV